jgi:hypothetical protein
MTGADESVDERAARVGRNAALIRAVNDQLQDLHTTFATADDEFAIVCECGDAKCVEQIEIVKAAYGRVRADPTLFFVVPGHQIPTVEAVVESQHAGYVVVRMPPGTGAEVAANTPLVRRDLRERGRLLAINSIVKSMRENGMSSEDDFHDVRFSMLPEHAEDFLASSLLGISWREVKARLEKE